MRIDEKIELYLNEISASVDRIKEAAKHLKDSLINDKKIKNKESYLNNVSTIASYLVRQGIIRPAKAQDLKYVEKIIKETKLLFNNVNEAKILKGSFTIDPMSGEDRAKILDLAKRKNINIISKHDKNGYVVVDLDRDSLKASMFLSALVTDSSAKFKEINEAAAPSKDEVAYVVGNAPGEPNKFIVYGSKEHAEKSMMKYALSPKKSLAKALFAANDEQGYTHYTIKYGYDAWTPIKRIPAKYLDADKYMVD